MEINIRGKKLRIHKFYLFIVFITMLKIIMMGIFSSDYQNKMFMPFVDNFIDQIKQGIYNPYEYYFSQGMQANFPYPPLMLFVESIGGFFLSLFSHLPLSVANLIFKLPLLFFDLLGLYYLTKLFPDRRKYVGFLYYLSPVVLYSTYMHGQLDIIPTALLIACIYYLTSKKKNHYYIATVFLAASVLTKFHILAVLPIVFLFLCKKEGLKECFKQCLLFSALVIIILLPFWSKGFSEIVLFNSEQQMLTKVSIQFLHIKIYIPILMVIILYFHVFNMKFMNKELFMSYCGVLFAVFLALVPPMPGWYVWIVPFVAIFFITIGQNKYKNILIYAILNGLYLLYFVFFHTTSYVDLYYFDHALTALKITDPLLGNIVFTLLTGTLLYTVFLMYHMGISSNSLYKRKNLPFSIGVAGDSGSGKSTFIDVVERCLGKNNLLFLEGDGDHKWERGEKMWDEYTHLNPKANYLYRQARDIKALRMGDSINRVEYIHDTGKFSKQHKIKPKNFIMLCGLHSFYLPQMRDCLDLKIYMDAEETLRRYWKIQRDVAHRGYSKEKIVRQIEDRMEDANQYIIPQREYADLVVQYFDPSLTDCYVDNYEAILSLKLTLLADINMEPFIHLMRNYGIHTEYDFNAELTRQTIVFDGNSLNKNKLPFEKIAQTIIPQLDEITRETLQYKDNISGITSLAVLSLISYKMQE